MAEELSDWTRLYGNYAHDELFVNESPLFFQPQEHHHTLMPTDDCITNNLVSSTLFSGPRIQDIENALGVVERQTHPIQKIFRSTVPILERSTLNRVDRYTLEVKNSSNGMIDDGYKWRKYGQKSIKNSPNPRSYYKCTNPICNAKKQVERSIDTPNTYIITYEGFHFHFTDPFFLPSKTHRPNKKPKIHKQDTHKAHFKINQKSQIQEESKQAQTLHQNHTAHKAQEHLRTNVEDDFFFPVDQCRQRQGLLEDVVAPAMINIPASDSFTAASWSSLSSYTSSSCSSSRTSSPPLSPSSLRWSPNFNIGFSDEILELIGSHEY